MENNTPTAKYEIGTIIDGNFNADTLGNDSDLTTFETIAAAVAEINALIANAAKDGESLTGCAVSEIETGYIVWSQPAANLTVPADVLSTFTAWCKASDRSESDVDQELSEIDTNVVAITTANREELMDVWQSTKTYAAQVIDKILSLSGSWEGLDWTVDDEKDTPEYRAQVEADAARAWEEAEECAKAAEAGRWEDAIEHAEMACSIEDEYGDCPTYRPLRDLVRSVIRATNTEAEAREELGRRAAQE